MSKVGYRFRFYPTAEQARELARTFGAVRYVYNFALRLRTDSYKAGKTINYNASSAAITALKKQPEHAWLKEISSVPPHQALRHLQSAFRMFFTHQSRYPKFKKKRGKQRAEYTRSGFRWEARTKTLTVVKLGKLKIRWSRQFQSAPSTVTITKDCADRYFIALTLDETFTLLPKTQQRVGIDVGINRLATLSTGERVANPRLTLRYERRLTHAHRVLSRRQKGSGRWQRMRLRVGKIAARIADTRADHLHKLTTDWVRRFDEICLEDLHVNGMLRNRHVAKHVADASFGNISRKVAYKCKWYGKKLLTVDRYFPSSKRCHVCGYIVESLRLKERVWSCPECGSVHDRDENAAKNIEHAAGHAVIDARGGRVRRVKAAALKRNARRTVNRSKSRALHDA